MSYLCYSCLFTYSSVQHVLTICKTGRVFYKKKTGTHYPSRAPVFTPGFEWSVLFIFLVFCVEMY